jgi:hypothetical protein
MVLFGMQQAGIPKGNLEAAEQCAINHESSPPNVRLGRLYIQHDNLLYRMQRKQAVTHQTFPGRMFVCRQG